MPAKDTPLVAARRQRLREWIETHYDGKQAAFISATGVNQGELSGLLRSKSFGEKRAEALERQAKMPKGHLVTPLATESHDAGWNLPMLSEALVSLDKAIRKRGLVWNAAYVAPALRLAYLERLNHPAKLDRAGYAAYDREVARQLQVQQAEHEPEQRRIEAPRASRAGKAPAQKAKARVGR